LSEKHKKINKFYSILDQNLHLNQPKNRSNHLNNCHQQRTEANRPEMIANQMRKADYNRPTQFTFIACKKPFGNGSGDNKVLAAKQKLREPKECEEVYPTSCGHCRVFDVTDLIGRKERRKSLHD
jgi:hypothetical protein